MSNSRHWAGGSTRAWRRVRAMVLARDQHRCQLQLDGCTTRATCVHHVRGKVMGDDPAWLLATARNLIGVPYSWADYAALLTHRLRIPVAGLLVAALLVILQLVP